MLMFTRMYVCMYVCMCMCMYVCVYVCMYVCMYTISRNFEASLLVHTVEAVVVAETLPKPLECEC